MGHLRYSTTGRAGMEYTHPFLRRNNWRSRTLMLCGNFNMTNADDIFAAVVASGQHPRLNCDTSLILEQLGNALDKENHRLYRQYRDTLRDPELAHRIEAEIDLTNMLLPVAPNLDGGYAVCVVSPVRVRRLCCATLTESVRHFIMSTTKWWLWHPSGR